MTADFPSDPSTQFPQTGTAGVQRTQYAGSDWVRASFKVTLSPFGEKVADILGELYQGIYHLDTPALRKVNWAHEYAIRIGVPDSIFATYDFDGLTHLVLLAHEHCIRVQIQQSGPRRLALCFSAREREGGISKRHPTLDQAVARFREGR